MCIRDRSYWEGRLCIFRWPYLVIPLKEENRFDMPQVGYGAQEGWFIKTTYNYYRNPTFRGFLYLDYFSRLGPGLGVKHLYDFGTLGAGSLSVSYTHLDVYKRQAFLAVRTPVKQLY